MAEQYPAKELTHVVPADSWPLTRRVDPQALDRVLEDFSRWHPEACRALAATVIPRPEDVPESPTQTD